jgi:4-alpha-glucanotransferase
MKQDKTNSLLTVRSAGVLLHITSLPGRFGTGELGTEAHAFVDWMAEAGFTLWQVLPPVPAGKGNSPYCSWTAFGGNPMFISLDWLVKHELLAEKEIAAAPLFPEDRLDFAAVTAFKLPLIRKAAASLVGNKSHRLKTSFENFCRKHADWLDDAVLFSLLSERYGEKPWQQWPTQLRDRAPATLVAEQKKLAREIAREKAIQFFFETQWHELRAHCKKRGVALVGDIPIYVGLDSSDVWTHRALFKLDKQGNPTSVAGVPPDAFSQTGQLWGNPVYEWPRHKAQSFAWWIARMERALELTDIVRIDHFRGLAEYWDVPAGDCDARRGKWLPGPGHALFHALKAHFGSLPIIAEDLGYITADVHELRDAHNLPGMSILQFAFGSTGESEHQPHTYPRNRVVYPGTHDNETLIGWWQNLSENTRVHARRYLGLHSGDPRAVAECMLRHSLLSHANLCIIPMQDILGLGNEARFNSPGTEGPHNWSWRMSKNGLGTFLATEWRERIALYGRAAS